MTVVIQKGVVQQIFCWSFLLNSSIMMPTISGFNRVEVSPKSLSPLTIFLMILLIILPDLVLGSAET